MQKPKTTSILQAPYRHFFILNLKYLEGQYGRTKKIIRNILMGT